MRTSLWRQRDFRLLGIGQGVSSLGTWVSSTALQVMAIVTLGAGPLEMGVLAVCSSAGILVVGPIAGAWVDRLPRRPVMIAADLARAMVLATIPVAALVGTLRIELLYLAALGTSSFSSFFEAAYRSYPPVLVPRERLTDANGSLSAVSSAAEITGPPLGGALVQFLSAPIAVALDALSFVASAISLAFIKAREARDPSAPPREPLLREIRHGVAFLAAEPSLRVIALSGVASALFGNFYGALYVLYGLDELGLSPVLVGVTVAAGGVGGLIAAPLAGRVARRWGIGRALIGTRLAAAILGFLMPLAAGPTAFLFLLIPQLIGDGLATISIVNAVTLRQLLSPSYMLGRVNATMHVLAFGVGPIGALIGATIAELYGIRAAVWVATIGIFAGTLVLFLPSPLLRMREVA